MFTKIDKYFTDKRKLAFAAGALVFALLWAFLWNAFPMPFYSIFFADIIGSNVQLVILNIVVLLPLFYIFTLLTKTELSFSKTVLLNIFLAVAVEYVFSIFLFSNSFYWCVIAYVIHSAVNVWTFGSAGVRDGKAPKGMRSPEVKLVPAIKTQPLISVIWAAAFSLCADAAGVALVYIIAHIYTGY
ncbi:MAG: hypothetical protein K2J76_09670 [Oscillospiraceae bacterium]|nr:hypothetical protein [Oscillospiraceae bacterium]